MVAPLAETTLEIGVLGAALEHHGHQRRRSDEVAQFRRGARNAHLREARARDYQRHHRDYKQFPHRQVSSSSVVVAHLTIDGITIQCRSNFSSLIALSRYFFASATEGT